MPIASVVSVAVRLRVPSYRLRVSTCNLSLALISPTAKGETVYTRAHTDFYELTSRIPGAGKASDTAVDLYYRHNPFKGGYGIAAAWRMRSVPSGRDLHDDDFLSPLAESS
jgi:hypothetical protein